MEAITVLAILAVAALVLLLVVDRSARNANVRLLAPSMKEEREQADLDARYGAFCAALACCEWCESEQKALAEAENAYAEWYAEQDWDAVAEKKAA